MRDIAELAKTDLIGVYDVRCHAPRSGLGGPEASHVTELVLPRQGAFGVETGGREIVADVGCALVLGAQEEYRVSHPGADGDRCTVLVAAEALTEEALGSVGGSFARLGADQVLAVGLFTNSLRTTESDQLVAEEISHALIDSVAAAFKPLRQVRASFSSTRVNRAKAMLAIRDRGDEVLEPWHLRDSF